MRIICYDYLENGMPDPKAGDKYTFKGTLEPFMPVLKDINFMAEVYE
jgi:hypothetical protein